MSLLVTLLIYYVSFVASSHLVPYGVSTEDYITNGLKNLKLFEKMSYRKQQHHVKNRLDDRMAKKEEMMERLLDCTTHRFKNIADLDVVQIEDYLVAAIETYGIDRTFACCLTKSGKLADSTIMERYEIAKEGGQNNILGCLQLFSLHMWPDMFTAHVYLAEVYKSACYDPDYWFQLWQQADFQKYNGAAYAANNPRFLSEMHHIPRNPQKYIPPLQLPYFFKHLKTIAVHDAVKTVEFFMRRGLKPSDLEARRDLLQTSCSLKILQFMQNKGIPFSLADVEAAIKYDCPEYLQYAVTVAPMEIDKQMELVLKHESPHCFGFLIDDQSDSVTMFLAEHFRKDCDPLPPALFELLGWKPTQEEANEYAAGNAVMLLKTFYLYCNLVPSEQAYFMAARNKSWGVVDFIKSVRPEYPTFDRT